MGPPRPAPHDPSLLPLPKDQPPQQIKSDTADLTVLQDDGVEVFDSVDIDDMGRGLYPATARWREDDLHRSNNIQTKKRRASADELDRRRPRGIRDEDAFLIFRRYCGLHGQIAV